MDVEGGNTNSAMRLVLAGTGASGRARVGALELARLPGLALETPAAALLTRGGSAVHLTGEVLRLLSPEPQLLLAPLAGALHLEPGARALGAGLARFCGAAQHVWWACTDEPARDPPPPSGHFLGERMPLWTRHGKQMMDVERYMDVMETFRPDVYVAPCDGRADALLDAPKRHRRAVERSAAMLAECVRRHAASPRLSQHSCLLGGVVGWGCERELQRSLEAVLGHERALGGLALLGLPVCERSTPADVARLLGDTLSDVPRRLLVACAGGAWSPACALEAVAHGCDLLHAGYATRLADAGRALAADLAPAALRDPDLDRDPGADADAEYILDLDDARYAEDMSPLARGCECAACARHSRAYVHHLRRTRELLAPVLLSLHNLHQYRLLLAQARRHIAAGTFPRYRAHVQLQEARYNLQHPLPPAEQPES